MSKSSLSVLVATLVVAASPLFLASSAQAAGRDV